MDESSGEAPKGGSFLDRTFRSLLGNRGESGKSVVPTTAATPVAANPTEETFTPAWMRPENIEEHKRAVERANGLLGGGPSTVKGDQDNKPAY